MPEKYSCKTLLAAATSNLDFTVALKTFNVLASIIFEYQRNPPLNYRVGRPSCLSLNQEVHLVSSSLKLLPEYGFDVTKDLALQLIIDYFQPLYLIITPGTKWLSLFVKRHARDIMWKKQEGLERIRAENFTEDIRTGWFARLKEVMTEHNLFDKSNQIFNVDESDFSDKARSE